MGFSGSISWDEFCHARCLLGIKPVKWRRWGPDWAGERGKCATQSRECFGHAGGGSGVNRALSCPRLEYNGSFGILPHSHQSPLSAAQEKAWPSFEKFLHQKKKSFLSSMCWSILCWILEVDPLQICSHLSHGGFFCFDDSICLGLPWHSASCLLNSGCSVRLVWFSPFLTQDLKSLNLEQL